MKGPRPLPEGTLNSLEYAWPDLLDPRDPWAGDEALPDTYDYANYLTFSEGVAPLDAEAYAAADRAFLAVYREVLGGRRPWRDIEAPARAIGVWGPARHDRRPLDRAPFEISNDNLVDHVEDWVPDIGLQAPDRVLGPWSEGAVLPALRHAAGAAVAFCPWVQGAITPAERVARSKPKPSKPYRAALRAIAASPPMIWVVDGDRLRPHLPISPLCVPTGPVRGLPEAPAVVGRAVPLEDGWFLACALPLPGLPPRAGMVRRLFLELLRARRVERRASWEDALRRRAEVIYRTAMGWAWLELAERSDEKC